MYLEGKKRVRFLLSAKRFEGKDSTFYISLNEDFPGLEYLPVRGHIARMERQDDKSYLLTLNQCHLCDKMLGHFHCGRGELEREVIARISHYFKIFRPCNAEYRYFQIHLPFISKYGKRKIWCPRAFHRSNTQLGNEVNVNEAIKRDGKSSIVLKSKPPVWNAELKSLVVKFQGNRVLIPSVKNFMLFASADASASYEEEHDTETEDEDSFDEFASSEDTIFQFDEQPHPPQSKHTKQLVPSSSSAHTGPHTGGHTGGGSGAGAGPGAHRRGVAGVTEVPKVVSALRWRSDSSIESPLRKTSRGKSFATGTPPGPSPGPSPAPSQTTSPKLSLSLTGTGTDNRYASMFQYDFPVPVSHTNISGSTGTGSSIPVLPDTHTDNTTEFFPGITVNRTLPNTGNTITISNTGNTMSNTGKLMVQTAPPTPSPETSPPPSRTNTTSYADTIPVPIPLPPSTPAKERERQRQEWRKIRQAYAEKYQQYILGGNAPTTHSTLSYTLLNLYIMCGCR